MNTLKMFRVFIVVSIVLGVSGAFFDALVPGVIPPALDDVYLAHVEAEKPQRLLALAAVAGLALLMAGIFAVIGLLKLKRWSRSLALWVTVAGLIILPPLFGVSLVSGWSYMLSEIATSLWAAALAMAYFSELKAHFERVERNPIAPNDST